MARIRLWIAAGVALVVGAASLIAASVASREHAVARGIALPPRATPHTSMSSFSPIPSATPNPTPAPAATTKRATVYLHYYLWWTNRHWHDKLGANYPYSTAPIPGTTDAQGCNPRVFYSGAQIVDVPTEGLYDQTQISTFTRHVDLANRAGITGFLANWQGIGTVTQGPQSSGYNSRFDLLVQTVDSYNRSHRTAFGLGLGYAAFGDYNRPASQVIGDLTYFYKRYGTDRAFRNGYSTKPIVMWLDSRKYPLETIRAVSAAVEPRVYLLGDETATSWQTDGRYLDGTGYYWSTQDPWNNSHAASAISQLGAEVHASGKRWFAPFIAGYDKQLLGGVCVQRRGLQTLRELWRMNRASHPNGWFGISWNEFVENTYLEPSKRNGATYLNAVSALIRTG